MSEISLWYLPALDILDIRVMTAITWLALGGIALTVGDIVFKVWVEKSLSYVSSYYVGGLLLYIIGLIFLVESFKTENIAVASAIFVLINIVTLAIFSWLYFGDKISLVQTIGLLLAATAILLLEI